MTLWTWIALPFAVAALGCVGWLIDILGAKLDRHQDKKIVDQLNDDLSVEVLGTKITPDYKSTKEVARERRAARRHNT